MNKSIIKCNNGKNLSKFEHFNNIMNNFRNNEKNIYGILLF